tara:strand:- start:877 stop:1272 length:396 start_codon:yes stop_codon:yes gene_type:complete
MIPYRLDGYRYYSYNSKLYRKWIPKLDRDKVNKLIKDFKAVIVMDVPYHDLVTWPKDKVVLTINYEKYEAVLDDVKDLCLGEEWFEECQEIENLKELKVKLLVYDLLNETDGIDVKDLQDDIIDKHDLDFK